MTRLLITGVGLVALAGSVGAQSPSPQRTDSAVLAYITAEVPRLMSELSIPGAVVTLVRYDRVVMNQGFGLADVARRIPVHPDSTEFRVASVAKVFTALAVLQQVESGKVQVNADVRPLLRDLGDRLGERPLTLHQLLTHTAGFDEQLIGYMKPVGAPVQSLTAYLSSSMPARTRPDSAVPGYSNHGYGLAGLVVERLTGQPFAQYADEHVFKPLGLHHTRFVFAPDDSALTHLAVEYRSDGTVRTRRSTRAYPAGNVGTTGADMSVFLRSLLTALRSENGAESRIARQMIGPMLTYHPAMPPMGYGFSGVRIAGRTVWMKGGAGPSHSALLAIIPELDIGLFIALNRQEPQLWDRLVPQLVHRFWADSAHDDSSAPDVRSINGTYRWTRAPLGSPEKIIGLATQVRITADDRGLLVKGPELGGRYERRAADRFDSSDGRRIAVRSNVHGDAAYLFSIVQGQPVSFERIAWYETAGFQLGAVALATLLALCAAGATFGRRVIDHGASSTRARVAVRALPIIEIVTIVVALQLPRQADRLAEGPTPLFRFVLVLATLLAIVGLAQTAGSILLAARARNSRIRRLILGAGALAGIGFAWILAWNHLVFPF